MNNVSVSYPIKFTSTGDTTAEVIYSACIRELKTIYAVLSALYAEVAAKTFNFAIKGQVANVSNLPTTGNVVGDMWTVVSATASIIYMWIGSKWEAINTGGVKLATESATGLATIGSLQNVVNKTASVTSLVNQSILESYWTTFGFACPKGTIVPWFGDKSAVPSGWALCNGANGTPDMNNKYVRGAADPTKLVDGGNDSFSYTSSPLLSHTHSVTPSVTVAAHQHTTVAATTGNQTADAHTHTFASTTKISDSTAGAHSHELSITINGVTYKDSFIRELTKQANKITYSMYSGGSTDIYFTPYVTFSTATKSAPTDVPGASVSALTTGGGHTHNSTVSFTSIDGTLSHTHTISGTSAAGGNANATVAGTLAANTAVTGTVTLSNLPASRYLYYIMKL